MFRIIKFALICVFLFASPAFTFDVVYDYPAEIYTGNYKLFRTRQWVIGEKHVTPLVYAPFELKVASVKVPSGRFGVDFSNIIKRITGKKEVPGVTVYFDFDSAEIKPEEAKKLDKFAQVLKGKQVCLKLTGYTDDIGTVKYNYRLGLKRAKSVKYYLQKRLKDAKFEIVSRGKCCFIKDKKGRINRKLSRRCTVEKE